MRVYLHGFGATSAAYFTEVVQLCRGTEPAVRELLAGLELPRTFLLPQTDGPLPGVEALAGSGVDVVEVPECGHCVMLDNPEGFVRATAAGFAR